MINTSNKISHSIHIFERCRDAVLDGNRSSKQNGTTEKDREQEIANVMNFSSLESANTHKPRKKGT